MIKILNWKLKLKLDVRCHLHEVLVSMQQNAELIVIELEAGGSE